MELGKKIVNDSKNKSKTLFVGEDAYWIKLLKLNKMGYKISDLHNPLNNPVEIEGLLILTDSIDEEMNKKGTNNG